MTELAIDTEAYEIYQKAEWKCRMSTVMCSMIAGCVGGLIFTILPSFIHSVVCMWCGNFDTSTWFFFLQVKVPLVDSSNIFVWYSMVILEILLVCTSSFLYGTIITYYMSCCYYIEACCEHFRLICQKIDEKIDEDPDKMIENIKNIEEKLGDAVSFHVSINE